ncbi:MAG: ABC transporter ATP-binding protein [Candidatus Limnocylindrales bacterium]
MSALLSVEGLSVSYGPIRAVRDVSFAVQSGEIVTIIGANCAGKTSILRAISGIVRSSGGRIVYDGRDITHLAPHRIVAAGIAQVPEGRMVFATLTVSENLQIATAAGRRPKGAEGTLEQVFDLFPRLAERRHQLAGTLSGGEQQMLAIGRALMADPRLMLLDEPSMGLAPNLITEIFRVIRQLQANGTTVLLVEQNARLALGAASRGYVLDGGAISATGTGAELLHDPEVQRAYLGS